MGAESMNSQERRPIFSTHEQIVAEFELLTQGKYGEGVEKALADKVIREAGDVSRATHEMVRGQLEAYKKFKATK